jgi:hypothetical protein
MGSRDNIHCRRKCGRCGSIMKYRSLSRTSIVPKRYNGYGATPGIPQTKPSVSFCTRCCNWRAIGPMPEILHIAGRAHRRGACNALPEAQPPSQIGGRCYLMFFLGLGGASRQVHTLQPISQETYCSASAHNSASTCSCWLQREYQQTRSTERFGPWASMTAGLQACINSWAH